MLLFWAWSESSPSATQLSSNWSKQELVDVGEVGPEAVVEQLDDAGEVLEVELLLAALALAEERLDLADLGGQRQRRR